jgi:predicted TIM-barrel fold metal-dependent hydrolase
MVGDTFVFDGVVHVSDMSFEHMKFTPTPEEIEAILDRTERLLGGIIDHRMGNDVSDVAKGSPEANYDVIFRNAPTDMAVVGNLPFFGRDNLYKDPNYPLTVNYRLAQAYPERCVFAGGVEPYGQTMRDTLASIERQVTELGARSMKFYPFDWRADDRELAYPCYEKCLELGVNVVQFHLCRPADSMHDVEMQRPNFLQRPARDFPDMTFVMHHPEPLYFEETVNIAARFPNIYLLVSPLMQLSIWRPRLVQKMIGQLLQQVGANKLIYGSEGALGGNPTKFIQAVLDFDIPEDLRQGYGYPQMTQEDKAMILGLNLARLLGIDVEKKKTELAELTERERGQA